MATSEGSTGAWIATDWGDPPPGGRTHPEDDAERHWLGGDRAADMLAHLGRRRELWLGRRLRGLTRPLRLWACACVRQSWDRLTDEVARRTVEVAEAAADDPDPAAGRDALAGAFQESFAALQLKLNDGFLAAAHGCTYDADLLFRVALQLDAANSRTSYRPGRPQGRHADLLRDIFGNPFGRQLVPPTSRPALTPPLAHLAVFDPAWLTPTVRGLAAAAYTSARPTCRYCNLELPTGESKRPAHCCPEAHAAHAANVMLLGEDAARAAQPAATIVHQDPATLAVLWDALEDAGCDLVEVRLHLTGREKCPDCLGDGTIVEIHDNHWGTDPRQYRTRAACRRCGGTGTIELRGPHVKGCWAVDLARGLRGQAGHGYAKEDTL